MVIAHFSRPRAYAFALGGLLLLAIFTLAVLYHPAGTTWKGYLDSKGLYRFDYAIGFFVCAAFLAARMGVILYQLLFRQAAAIWTNGEYVFFVDTWWLGLVSKFRIEDIQSASTSTWRNTNWPCANVKLRDGQNSLPAWLLREPTAAIALQLQSLNSQA